ncbi:Inorganic triphosphatase [Baekduia alba]|uniref:CYTH domain-containing protein n=1 Tax=Baekduia alba TaxID=2997333 RepID=UPI00234267A6|nr:CYTH domain-containing protein [Baekduia alba]WCB92905.1 Inorganic triphosphatase [Baekduia alba]
MAEIERKWLVRTLPSTLERWPSSRLEQGYLAITDDVEVRVRRFDGDAARLTVKSSPALSRVEEEMALEDGAFDRLWPLTEGRRLVKVRHTREDAPGVVFELDLYEDALDGLVTLEVEFADEAASERFAPPPWAGREVTGDKAYANQTLAVHGRP